MVFVKHNPLKSDIFFNPIFIPGFSGFRIFRIQGPGSGSRTRVQVQGPGSGFGSRIQGPGSGFQKQQKRSDISYQQKICPLRNQSNLENIVVGKDHRRCLQLEWCNKLKKNRVNNILAMKINFAFEFNSTNSSSADTNLETFRFYQKS